MPSTPTALTATSKWIAWRANGAISNKAAVLLSFTSVEIGQHRIQAVLGGVAHDVAVTGDGVRTAIIYGLALSSAYTLQIRSENGGLSGWKTLALATPAMPANAGAISVPTGLTANVSDPGRVVLTWTDNADNESSYRVILYGPERFIAVFYAEPFETSITIPVLPNATGRSLLFATAYVVSIAALGGRFKTRGFTPLETAYSAEVAFTTAAPQIVITNLPARARAWNGVAFAFQMTVSQTPTSFAISSGALPAGVTLNTATGLVSGTPAATAGTYTAALRANNAGGHDIATLTLDLATPTFLLRLTDGTPADSIDLAGGLAVPFVVQLVAVAVGPIAAANSWSLAEKPAWLTIDAGTGLLGGTPTESGAFVAVVTAGNGTQSATVTLSIVIRGAVFTSPDELTIFAGVPFSFSVTALPDGCTFSVGDLPAGVTLQVGTDLRAVLSGTVALAGDYDIDLGAAFGIEGATQSFTLHVLAEATFAPVWEMVVGQPQRETIRYNGAGLVDQWFLSSAPPGLAIGFASEFTAPCALSRNSVVTGAPTAPGIYDAVITAQIGRSNGTRELHRFPVRINVSGGLFLAWFHANAALRELQFFARSNEVAGYYFEGTDGAVVVRGDPTTFHVILRDGPIHLGELGLRTLETGLTDLKFMVRPKDDYDSEPWIETGGAVVTAALGDHTVFVLTFTPSGDEIKRRFTALNQAPGADPTQARLTAIGELTGTLNGQIFTSKPFPVTIRQDVDR